MGSAVPVRFTRTIAVLELNLLQYGGDFVCNAEHFRL